MIRNHFPYLLFFILITIIQLYPFSIYPFNRVHDLGDPLLNSYILWWVGDKLFHDPLNVFNANIYYPHHNTIAFSDNMLPLAFFAYPFYLITKNPIFSYNAILLISFVINAYAIFLLAYKLTNNSFSGIISGLIFSFSSYKMMHISHIQLLASMWIPLYFLYLHKFLENNKFKDSIFFAFFFLLQALSSVYYGLFSISILIFILPLFLFIFKRINIDSLLKLILPLFIAGLILFLLSIPYMENFKKFHFKRPLFYGAELQNYLAPLPQNIIFGKLLSNFGTHEKYLFPGFIALALAIFSLIEEKNNHIYYRKNNKIWLKLIPLIKKFLLFFTIANLFFIVLIILSKELSIGFNLFKHPLRVLCIVVLNLFIIMLSCLVYKVSRNVKEIKDKIKLLYLCITILALFFSFGKGFGFMGNYKSEKLFPFNLFYNYVMGFAGIREPSRYAVFVLFGIAILAGLGSAKLFERFKNISAKYALAALILFFINLEYLSIPLRSIAIPVSSKDIPPIYTWLKNLKEDAIILEYPFFPEIHKESIYMYLAIYHKKKIVNGYSGFIPCSADFLRENFNNFPNIKTLEMLKELKVNYVIIHLKMFPNEKAAAQAMRKIEKIFDEFKFIKRFQYAFTDENAFQKYFGDDIIYKLEFNNIARDESSKENFLKELPNESIKLEVSSNSDQASLMIDNNLFTAWDSGKAKMDGEFIQVDLGKPQIVSKISLYTGENCSNYAINFNVIVSLDGKNWRLVPIKYSKAEYLMELFSAPVKASQDIWMNDIKARYIRILQTGISKKFHWSVAELKILVGGRW